MSDKYSSHCIYNGTHPFLEMSEEELRKYEPANCKLCGKEDQFKNLMTLVVNSEVSMIVCRDCHNDMFRIEKNPTSGVFSQESYDNLVDKTIEDMDKPPKGETVIYKRRD